MILQVSRNEERERRVKGVACAENQCSLVGFISLLGQHLYLTFKQLEFQIEHFNLVCADPQ